MKARKGKNIQFWTSDNTILEFYKEERFVLNNTKDLNLSQSDFNQMIYKKGMKAYLLEQEVINQEASIAA